MDVFARLPHRFDRTCPDSDIFIMERYRKRQLIATLVAYMLKRPSGQNSIVLL